MALTTGAVSTVSGCYSLSPWVLLAPSLFLTFYLGATNRGDKEKGKKASRLPAQTRCCRRFSPPEERRQFLRQEGMSSGCTILGDLNLSGRGIPGIPRFFHRRKSHARSRNPPRAPSWRCPMPAEISSCFRVAQELFNSSVCQPGAGCTPALAQRVRTSRPLRSEVQLFAAPGLRQVSPESCRAASSCSHQISLCRIARDIQPVACHGKPQP